GHGGDERDHRDPRGNRHGVDDPVAVVRLVEEGMEVFQRRRQVEPERDVAHAVEIRLLLERRHRPPEKREPPDEEKGRDRGVEQKVTPDLLLTMGAGHRSARHQSLRFKFRSIRKSAGNSSGTSMSAIAEPRPRLPAWMPIW